MLAAPDRDVVSGHNLIPRHFLAEVRIWVGLQYGPPELRTLCAAGFDVPEGADVQWVPKPDDVVVDPKIVERRPYQRGTGLTGYNVNMRAQLELPLRPPNGQAERPASSRSAQACR